MIGVRRFTYVTMSAPPPRPNLTGLTVLVVEDDQDSLDMIETLLRSCGARVLAARNAAAGFAYVDTTPKLDALITDIALSDVDGAELARRVRRHPTKSRLPIIAITAFYEDHVNRPEFDAYMRKPFDIDHLCGLLARLARGDA
jgi:CheY-like chemotaxis protein